MKPSMPGSSAFRFLQYQLFPKDVFRKHIHQEVRSLTEPAYWLVKAMQKQEKKDKKKAKKLRAAEFAGLENHGA
jgi:hypothetical protein